MQMKKLTRLLIVLALLGAGCYVLYPTFQWYVLFSNQDRDEASLQGTKLKLEVNKRVTEAYDGLIEGEVEKYNDEFKEIRDVFLKKDGKNIQKVMAFENIEIKKDMTFQEIKDVLLKYRKKEDKVETYFKEILENYYKSSYEKKQTVKTSIIKLGLDLQGGANAVVTVNFDHPNVEERYPEGVPEEKRREMIDFAVQKIQNRIDKYGLSEVQIQKLQDQNKIIISLPGVKETTELSQIVETVGVLEFKLVSKEGSDTLSTIQLEYDSRNESIFYENGTLKLDVAKRLPPDTEVLSIANKDKWGTDREEKLYMVVEKESLLDLGKDRQDDNKIVTAAVETSGFGQNAVTFELAGDYAIKWGQVTGENVGRQIAIVLDGVILQSPVVQEQITGGRSQITLGNSPIEELNVLKSVLQSGSLSVPLEISEENTVGASLGRDTIEKGLVAILLGVIFVVVFMFAYYNLGGLIANAALILNFFLLIAGLAMFKGTLTLPGIAGIILTVGMAVDANVIIYERIKEEYRTGKTFKTAVNLGFSRALWTIIDANITTFAAALGVSLFGRGPIKGFAVTLCIGIVCSMFSSLFFSKLVFDTITSKVEVKSLRIFSLIKGE